MGDREEFKIKKKEKQVIELESETSPVNMLKLPLSDSDMGPPSKLDFEEQKAHLFPRQLYIGNLPSFFIEKDLIEHLFKSMQAAACLIQKDNPVLSLIHIPDRKFALVELRSFEETTALLALNGLVYVNLAE
mgnify:CR=1 FL=1